LLDQQRRFVGDAAHELRTPITALSLQAENLNSVDLPEVARDRVAALKQGMQRTRHLLEQLLALARQEATSADRGEMPLVALDDAAKEAVADLLPHALDRGIDLGFPLVEPLTVRGEPVMLATMVRNLLDNALRFTPRAGSVDIGVYREEEAAVLQVEDTGPGIAPCDLQRIFEPFFRGSRPEGDGSGRLIHREARRGESGRLDSAGKHLRARSLRTSRDSSFAPCSRSVRKIFPCGKNLTPIGSLVLSERKGRSRFGAAIIQQCCRLSTACSSAQRQLFYLIDDGRRP
jgi:C4-dicarboxylate-specific signal transduction histidine kinase